MSCRNFELLTLHLDIGERLLYYRFEKSQCRSEVGEASLLLPHLKGLKAERLMTMVSERFCQFYPASEPWQQYLYLKHFIAIKGALQAFFGKTSGGVKNSCTIESIAYDNEGTVVKAQIEIEPSAASRRGCVRCEECNN